MNSLLLLALSFGVILADPDKIIRLRGMTRISNKPWLPPPPFLFPPHRDVHRFLPPKSTTLKYTSTETTTTEMTQNTNSSKMNSIRRPAQKACDIYLKMARDRIAGGNPAESGEFPWMAALGYLNIYNFSVSFDCGGTVISERFILTAAHCVEPSRLPVIVRMGKLSLTDGDGITPENLNIQEFIRHTNHSTLTKRNDIALIRVTKQISFTAEIAPACLQIESHDLDKSVKLIVSGWGSNADDHFSRSETLHKAQLISMSLSECNRNLQKWNAFAHQAALEDGINNGQYCAYDPKGKNDSCLGDSGGPLQYFPFKGSNTAMVVGIVSYGFGCGTELPSIYTRVAAYLDWIESYVWSTTL